MIVAQISAGASDIGTWILCAAGILWGAVQIKQLLFNKQPGKEHATKAELDQLRAETASRIEHTHLIETVSRLEGEIKDHQRQLDQAVTKDEFKELQNYLRTTDVQSRRRLHRLNNEINKLVVHLETMHRTIIKEVIDLNSEVTKKIERNSEAVTTMLAQVIAGANDAKK